MIRYEVRDPTGPIDTGEEANSCKETGKLSPNGTMLEYERIPYLWSKENTKPPTIHHGPSQLLLTINLHLGSPSLTTMATHSSTDIAAAVR